MVARRMAPLSHTPLPARLCHFSSAVPLVYSNCIEELLHAIQYGLNHGVGHLTACVRGTSPSRPQAEGMRGRRRSSCVAARGRQSDQDLRTPLIICLRSCYIYLLCLCENHEFRTKMNTLIPLGFLCAKDRCIIGA